MQVFTFDLNEAKTARLVVTVSNVPPIFQVTPALIHAPGRRVHVLQRIGHHGDCRPVYGEGLRRHLYLPVSHRERLPFPQVVIDLMKA
jgi:hypothetical protein